MPADPPPAQHDEPLPAPGHDPLRLDARTQRVAQWFIAALVIGGLTWFVASNWDDFVHADWEIDLTAFSIALVLYLLSEGMRPFAWRQLMHSAGTRAPVPQTLFVWFSVEPTQYLPIPVGPFIGRFVLADRVGLSPAVAIVTLAYEWTMLILLPVVVAYPALIWIAIKVAPEYRWSVYVVAAFLLLFGWSMLRRGGISRTISDMMRGFDARDEGRMAEARAEMQGVAIPRRALIAPAVVTFVSFLVRVTAAGVLLGSLTPIPWWQTPFYGLVFAAGATMPFGRFGTREAFIIAGLSALGVGTGPATVAAITSRALGLLASLLLLGLSVLLGGAKRPPPPDAADGDAEPPPQAPLPLDTTRESLAE
ncbi:MAG: flippase-like domain-containing protein [Acidimicrobiia bacterium]|nr:flippase-like domain-containing protein [Acidimicrobiia bacterium]